MPHAGRHEGYEFPWVGLALAVIARATMDVRRFVASPRTERWMDEEGDPKKHAMDALEFLHSPWATNLAEAGDLPGESWQQLLAELDAAMFPLCGDVVYNKDREAEAAVGGDMTSTPLRRPTRAGGPSKRPRGQSLT
jgi:hypothetical protein